jgi:electron transfer flavoprotein beta subunit
MNCRRLQVILFLLTQEVFHMLQIIVCAKIVMDPEMPFSLFKVDKENMQPIPPDGVPPVASTFDENALEAALKIKDQQECKITVISMGKMLPKAILQKMLAVGADEVIGVEDPIFDNLDPFNTAIALAAAIQKVGEYDLIFMGRQSADWDSGLVWAGVAEALDLPSITIAQKAEVANGQLTVERCVADGVEVLESDMPALLTFTSEAGEIRFASLPALMKAKKKTITKWSATDIGFETSDVMLMKEFYEPDLGEVDCSLIQGESDEEKGHELAKRLITEGII